MDALAGAGCANFYEDETAMLLSTQTSRGWLRRGDRETIKNTFSKRAVKVFLRTGRGMLHLMPADSTRSTVFRVFLEALRQKYGRVVFVTGNASSHKSQHIQEYP